MDKTSLTKEFPATVESAVEDLSHASRERHRRENASIVASGFYETKFRDSKLSKEKMAEIPRFSTKEIIEGFILGTGGFCSVYEIRGFNLDVSRRASNEFDVAEESVVFGDAEVGQGQIESRKFIAKHCYRYNGDARYALKRLKKATIQDSLTFLNGMSDLSTETQFLAVLEHPNIIKLRGIAMEEMFSEKYFLVLDRLYDTLEARIVKWQKRTKKARGIIGSFKDKQGKEKQALQEEKMTACLDLASALAYIHNHRIIHRDLKTENIGFDVRGDIKIFDLGLAKEMTKLKEGDTTYAFTGMCGTPRYMAPEVALSKPYNESCDLYSLGLLLWQILNLKKPYDEFKTLESFQKKIWAGPQCRPDLSKGRNNMTTEVKNLLK